MSSETKPGELIRTLFSRDLGYLRDSLLFWPLVLYSIFGVASLFSEGHRRFGLLCIGVAVAALLAARERVLMFVVASGFIAIQCGISLLLHTWNRNVFVAGLVASCPLLLACRHWRSRRLAYKVPRDFRLVDALWSIGSLVGALLLLYLFRLLPDSWR